MTEPAPEKAAPPPKAPGMTELFEQALHAVVSPSVFRAAAARPAPSFGAAAGLALASGAAAFAVNLAHAAVQSPEIFSRFSPPLMAAVGFAALGLYASMVLLMGVMLYGLGGALGGKGDFDRGMQAAAMLSVVFPLQMLCNWFPLAWVLPSALGAWLAACALEGLFGAKPVPARALCVALASGAIGLQAAGRVLADRARQAYAASQVLTQTAGGAEDLGRQMQALQQQAAAAAASGALAMPEAQPAQGAAAPAASGLDLLKGPDDAGAPPPAGDAAAPPPEAAMTAAKGMQTSTLGMLDAIAPMLNNPAMTKNMTPQQKADMKALQDIMADLKAQINSGHSLSDPAFAQKFAKVQQLSMRMMAAGMQAPPQPKGK
jgi:hypothetical protein